MIQRHTNSLLNVTIFLALLAISSCVNKSLDNDAAIVKIAVREAAHQLLITQNDTVSLINPITVIEPQLYLLSFQDSLSFKPNDLVTAISSSFEKSRLSHNYRVEVLEVNNGAVAYSYEMNESEALTIIPCAGRLLPYNSYQIKVLFLQESNTNLLLWILAFIILFILITFIYKRFILKKEAVDTIHSESSRSLGLFTLITDQQALVLAARKITLSNKEYEILIILMDKVNQVVKREELAKKVWEDNGVVVGRSLDTYISKLRKILKADPSLKISNVHGVGYRLETETA